MMQSAVLCGAALVGIDSELRLMWNRVDLRALGKKYFKVIGGLD
jgi:hypothetical protein